MNQFAQQILLWYKEHKRDLPWRNISDPYKIWVSEIILQQTRIAQGYDYYLRFIKAFPTVKALAEATEDEVLRMWQGLGYYSRARNMHSASVMIMNEHEGVFPEEYNKVRALKGIGDYTAAAICSFAYNLPYAVVDGNVYRVLSRFFGITQPIDTTDGKKYFARFAKELLPTTNSADYNQGLMDFGAMQCIPLSPNCAQCVLNETCFALHEDKVTLLPVKSKKIKVRERYFSYVKVVHSNKCFLHRRIANDIWKGLYEFPLFETDHQPDDNEIMQHEWFLSLPTKGTWHLIKRKYKHVLTHQVIYANYYVYNLDKMINAPKDFIIVKTSELNQYAMPQLLQKLIQFEK